MFCHARIMRSTMIVRYAAISELGELTGGGRLLPTAYAAELCCTTVLQRGSMRMMYLRFIARNVGYPLAAAFLGISACGFLLDIKRMATGQRHPLTVIFAIATVVSGTLFFLAQRRLARSFRGDL